MRRSILLVAAALAAVALGMPGASARVLDTPPPPVAAQLEAAAPPVTAQAWILYDATFDRVLGEAQADERRAVASATKIMSALVALEQVDLNDLVTVSEEAAGVGEAEIGLEPEEQWEVRDLLIAMLVASGNDAAMAVAEHVGGSVESFVELMNQKAEELGLANTHFDNPHGLDHPDHYSSARDLLTMAQSAMADERFAQIVGIRRAQMPPTEDGIERVAESTNLLLRSLPGVIGVKTGYTSDAGRVLVVAAERDGRRIYAVVLGSDDHFADGAALLEYGFTQFGLHRLITRGVTYAQVRNAEQLSDLIAVQDVDVFSSVASLDRLDLEPEVTDGRPVLIATIDGEEVARSPLSGVESESLPSVRDALRWAARYWEWIRGNG